MANDVVIETDLEGLTLFNWGKVRDIYDLGESLLIVASDRISAFDSILGSGIPVIGLAEGGYAYFGAHGLQIGWPNGWHANHFEVMGVAGLSYWQTPGDFTGALPGPLGVTADMQTLGLQNTFLAGYFYTGAPLLQRIETPGNTRPDVNTNPDLYNQTSPTDMGALLTGIYQCATQGGGMLIAAFPGQITQEECQTMIDYLSRNKIGV